ncbi:MAG: type II secretion system protein GspJ [Deltaproteobacteria bacterium]
MNYSERRYRDSRAFTLVEAALAAALMAVVGLVVFKTFASGLRLWQRQDEGAPAREAAFFFERVQRDIENGCRYGAWVFWGNATQVEFPGYAGSLLIDSVRVPSPARVRYAWEEAAGAVGRVVVSLTDDLQGAVGAGRPVLSGVERFDFSYYFLDPQRKEYVWAPQWPPGDVALKDDARPLAVRVEMTLRRKKKTYDAVRIFSLPLGG